MQPQGVPGRSLLSNPLIAQALQQQGGQGGGSTPQPGQQPLQGQPMPPQGAPQTPPPPVDPKSEETKIILGALTGHLKFLEKVQLPPQPAAPQQVPQQAQQALLANRPMGGL